MGKIQGAGDNQEANVNSKGRLEVAAFSEDVLQDAADIGNAYTFSSTFSASGGEEVLSFKNTSASLHFHGHGIFLGNTVDTLWTFFKVTSGTAAGTTLTPRNLDIGSADNAPATVFGNASVSGSLSGNTLYYFYTLANATPAYFPFAGGLRIGENQEIAITTDAGGVVAVTLVGLFS